MKKKTLYIVYTAILMFVLLTRVINLAGLPEQMHIDETGLGLNAWSIANYGTDRYGNFIPVFPANFYGEQSAFYTYFCALLVKIFGLNLFTLRLPAAILGTLTVVFGSLLCKEKYGDKGLITGAVLLGIFPYFIMNSRFALDCNAMLCCSTIALYALTVLTGKAYASPNKKFYGFFCLVGFLFGIILYTYIISAFVVALFCLGFGLFYLFSQKESRSLRFKQLLFMAIPVLLMSILPICVVAVNYFDLRPIETPFFTISKLVTNRTEEVSFSLSKVLRKLPNLRYIVTTDGKYGSSDRFWTMYHISIPFILLGIYFSAKNALAEIKNHKTGIDLYMLLFSVAEVIMFLFCGLYNYHINGIFIALGYFCITGCLFTVSMLEKSPVQEISRLLIIGVYSVYFGYFLVDYYILDKGNPSSQVYGGVDEAIALIPPELQTSDIYIPDEIAEFYLLSHPIAPSEFVTYCDSLGYVKDYGNLHFYNPEIVDKDTIYICNKNSAYYQALSAEINGFSYQKLETANYCVFISK